MPFKSKAQMRYLLAKEPIIAERWMKEGKTNYGKLPNHVKKSKKK